MRNPNPAASFISFIHGQTRICTFGLAIPEAENLADAIRERPRPHIRLVLDMRYLRFPDLTRSASKN